MTDAQLYKDTKLSAKRFYHPDYESFRELHFTIPNKDPASPIDKITISYAYDSVCSDPHALDDHLFDVSASLKPAFVKTQKWHELLSLFHGDMSHVDGLRLSFIVHGYNNQSHATQLPELEGLGSAEALEFLVQKRLITDEARDITNHAISMIFCKPDKIKLAGPASTLLDVSDEEAKQAIRRSMKQFNSRSPV